MQIIVVRHAVAEDREEFFKKSQEDHLRPLIPKGKKKMQRIAKKVREWIENVDLIVTSPYTRARQTAEILKSVFPEAKVVEAVELVPQSSPQAFIKWIQAHGREVKCIMIVGHEPQLSSFISFLLSAQRMAFIELKKSGVACLEVESFYELSPGSAQLSWLIQPKMVSD